MPFKHNSLLNKLIHICLIFTLLSAWFYTGRPRLEHLNFPPAPQTARAAIAFDAASEGNTGSAGSSSLTVSHTIGAAGTNRILMVGVNIFSSTSPMPTVTVLKYANVDMTFIDAQENTVDTVRIRSELWYIKAPATGANNIAITFSESVQGVAGGMSYTGVDQTTPLGAAAKAGGTSSTASVAVSSATGELVVDTVGARQNSGGTLTLTQVANQTERYNDTSGTNGNNNVVGAGSEEAGAGTVTMSWTISSSARWAIVAVPIKPLTNSAPGIPTLAETPAFFSMNASTTRTTIGNFSATDPNSDAIQYDIQWDDDFFFGSPVTNNSADHATNGFSAATFASGAAVSYEVQAGEALTNGTTYYWRTRARDPSGSNTWSGYSVNRSLTIDTSITVDNWLATTGHQFSTGTLSDIATTSGAAKVSGW